MSRYLDPAESSQPYKEPTPLPADIPKVKELGVTSAPLKSAAFFLGAYCKDYNGACRSQFKGMRGMYRRNGWMNGLDVDDG